MVRWLAEQKRGKVRPVTADERLVSRHYRRHALRPSAEPARNMTARSSANTSPNCAPPREEFNAPGGFMIDLFDLPYLANMAVAEVDAAFRQARHPLRVRQASRLYARHASHHGQRTRCALAAVGARRGRDAAAWRDCGRTDHGWQARQRHQERRGRRTRGTRSRRRASCSPQAASPPTNSCARAYMPYRRSACVASAL